MKHFTRVSFIQDFLLAGVWHLVVFIACVRLPPRVFDARLPQFRAWKWEREGRWYREKLKINRWKDKLPQHIASDGFSKRNLTGLSPEYLDEFILETCRGEWMHLANCLCAVAVLLLDPTLKGVIVALLILAANLPFAIIQRYNRFRMLPLRDRMAQRREEAALAPAEPELCPKPGE